MAEGVTLENMYFDVLLRDRTAEGVRSIEQNIKDKLKIELDVGNANSMNAEFAKMGETLKGIKQTLDAINESMGGKGGGGGASHLEDSYKGIKQQLDTLMSTWKEYGAATREGAGKAQAEEIRNLAAQLRQLDAELKPAVITLEKLNNLKARLDSLNSGGTAKEEVVTQQQISAQTRLIQLQEQAKQLGISTAGMNAQQLEIAVQAQNKLNAAIEREKQLQDPNSAVSQLEKRKKEAAAMAEQERMIKKLVDLEEKRDQLRARSGYHYDVHQLQQQISEENKLLQIEQKLNAERERMNGNPSRVQQLQQEYEYTKKLNDLNERINALNNPQSGARDIMFLEQRASLLERIFQRQLEIANLNMSVQGSDGVTRTVAEEQARLSVNERLVRAKAELAALQTQEGRELQQLQQQASVEKQLTQLETQRLVLQQQLAALRNGNDITNTALRQEVQLEQNLIALIAKENWLRQQSRSGSGLTNAQEMRQVQERINSLLGRQTEHMRQQFMVMESLKNLARNYIGVFGAWSAIKSLYRIRGEFERQEVALRALMQSASQAREAMGELQQMALRSPFGVGQLVGYAKQLSAYNIANNELLDTTKRLADLSAGLGVDMQRIILAYGQVKAATVLRGQELRQFTEAGIPMVQSLADHFTKLEGRVVSAADVFDRISKKMVTFNDVKTVIEGMTDEGGRFFNHQEKMVESLYGKMQRMGDAFKVMMNNLGKSNDTLLKAPIDAITSAMINWRSLLSFLVSTAATIGSKKLWTAFIGSQLGKDIQNATQNLGRFRTAWTGLGMAIRHAGKQMAAFFSANWIYMAIFAVTQLIGKWQELSSLHNSLREDINGFGKELSDELKEYFDTNRSMFTSEGVLASVVDERELMKIWESLRDKLVQMKAVNIGKLIEIGDLRERCNEAIKIINSVNDAAKALEETTVEFNETLGWVLGDVPLNVGEGLAQDINDYVEALEFAKKKAEGSIGFWEAFWGGGVGKGETQGRLLELQDEIADAAEEIQRKLSNAISQGFIDMKDNDAINQYVVQIVEAFKRLHPEIKKEAIPLFENMLYSTLGTMHVQVGNMTYEIKSGLSESAQFSQATLDKMTAYLQRAARDTNVSLQSVFEKTQSGNEQVRAEGEKQYQQLFRKMLEYAKENGDYVYNYIAGIVSDLNRLRIYIPLTIGDTGGGSGEFRQMWEKRWKKGGKMPPSYVEPQNGEESYSYGQRMETQAKEAEKAKRYAERQKAKAKSEDEAAMYEKQRAEAAEREKHYREQADAYYEDMDKKETKKTASPKKTGGGRQRDEVLDRMKEEFKEYKEANELVRKLVKSGSTWTNAVEEVQKMPWMNKLDSAYLGSRGMVDYYEDVIPKVKEHYGKVGKEFKRAVREFWLSLSKEASEETERGAEEFMRQVDSQVKRLVDVGVKNFNLYDKIFEATGDKDLASSVAFGGHKLFNTIEDYLVEQLKTYGFGSTIKIPLGELLEMDDESLKRVFEGNEAEEIVKQIRQLRDQGYSDIWEKAASALEKYYTLEEKVNAQASKNEKDLADYIAKGLGEAGDEGYNALVRQGEDAIREIQSEGLKLSKLWDDIFGDMEDASYGKVKRGMDLARQLVKNATAGPINPNTGRPDWYTSWYEDENGKRIDLPSIALDAFKELEKIIKSLAGTLTEKNPFRSLKDAFNQLRKKPNTADWKNFGEALSSVADICADLADKFSEMFDAAGNETLSEVFEDMGHALSSVSNIAKGFSQGGVVGGVVAAAGEAIGWISSIFQRHDKRLQKSIDDSKRRVKELEYAYTVIERTLERSLGGIFSREAYNSYDQMLKNLSKQREETRRQMDDEREKKKSDKDAIIDYQNKIDELDDQIKNFSEDLAKQLYDIDIKSWAKELTDAIVDAWAQGENAAEAFKNKVNDIVKSLAKNILAQRVMEIAMQPVLDLVTSLMEQRKGRLNEGDIVAIADSLMKNGLSAVDIITGVLEQLKAQGYDLTSTGNGNTLGKGIQSITEDTANLLASYVNAIRADVSVIRMLHEQQMGSMSEIALSQVAQLNQIAANTLRNAEAAERIETAIGSVIMVGADGAMLRV